MGEPCVVDCGGDAEGDAAAEDVEVSGFGHCDCFNSIEDGGFVNWLFWLMVVE